MSMNKGKIYIAAFGEETERAKYWIKKMREAGWEISHDWTDHWFPNEVELPHEERVRIALLDANGVLDSNVLWMLAPTKGGAGVFTELGIAIGFGMSKGTPERPDRPQIIASGAWKRNIFTALADRRFDTDEEAFAHLTGW